jgi:hypothetical protein
MAIAIARRRSRYGSSPYRKIFESNEYAKHLSTIGAERK